MLSKRQKEILDFIKSCAEKEAYAPSLDEIKKHLGLASVSTVHYHVNRLRESGYLEKTDHRPRSLNVRPNEITTGAEQEAPASFSAPVYGMANAGAATIFAEENLSGYVKIPPALHLKRKKFFAVQVRGDSMNLASIGGKRLEDGDFALIDPDCRTPENGDCVLSIIDDRANLKQFERERKTGAIRLVSRSTNKAHKPMYVSSEDRYMVNGKVVAVIKK